MFDILPLITCSLQQHINSHKASELFSCAMRSITFRQFKAAADEAARGFALQQMKHRLQAIRAAAVELPIPVGRVFDAAVESATQACTGNIVEAAAASTVVHTQALAAIDVQREAVSQGPPLSDAACAAMDKLLWYSMSLQLLSGHAAGRSPVCDMHLVPLLQDSLDEVGAFAVEKFGVKPPVEIAVSSKGVATSADKDVPLFSSREHVMYIVRELLKNAMRAQIDRYGAAGVDDAPPLLLRVASAPTQVSVCVSDRGGGWVAGAGAGAAGRAGHVAGPITRFSYFSSSAFKRAEPNYQYSREHGVPFTGYGLGLPRARVYARMLGGGLSVTSQPGWGCDALFCLDRHGFTATDDIQQLQQLQQP